MKSAYFDGFIIHMTEEQALSASHPGACDSEVEELVNNPKISKELDQIDPIEIEATLREYGAWDYDELQDREANRRRIIWIAAGDIREELNHGGITQ